MLKNTTFNLPEELVARAKSYAAAHGTTMTAIVREHLAAITADPNDRAVADPLVSYSRGLIGREEAIRLLGLRDYVRLLVALGDADLAMPMPPPHEIENQAIAFVNLWDEANTIIIPEAWPFTSLWVADRLAVLLKLDVTIVVVDAVYDEMTGDAAQRKDREVKAFLDGMRDGTLVIEETFVGKAARAARKQGTFDAGRRLGDAAIAEFMANGLGKYLSNKTPALLLFEDRDWRVFGKPSNLHPISMAGMLHGLERIGKIASADDAIHQMTHPTASGRRPGR